MIAKYDKILGQLREYDISVNLSIDVSGALISDVNTSVFGNIPTFSSVSGKLVTDSGFSAAKIDSSLKTLTTRYNFTEASLNIVGLKLQVVDLSLNALTTRHNFTESSLGVLTTRHNFTESSLGVLTVYVDSSILNLTNRVNIIDSSLSTLTSRHNFTESSLATLIADPTFIANVGTPVLKLTRNPSIGNFAAGKMYYDETHYTISAMIDDNITLQLGQEEHILVYNNTGTTLFNGKAVYIDGAISGVPSVSLALSSGGPSSIAIGVTTQDISANSIGIVTTRGIVHELDTSVYIAGDIIYLSDTIPGNYTTDISSLLLTSHINTLGYVLTSGAAGSIYVLVKNETIALSLTESQRNAAAGNTISTGVYDYTGASVDSSTRFSVSPTRGWIVKNTGVDAITPKLIAVLFDGSSNIATPYRTSSVATYILLDSSSNLIMQPIYPTASERRNNIFLGKIVHSDRMNITTINNMVDYDNSPMSALRDMFAPIRLINDSITIYPNGENLKFNMSAGQLYGMGINWVDNNLNPNNVSIFSKMAPLFKYKTQLGGPAVDVSTLNPTLYDLNGVLTAVPSTAGAIKSTNQRVYLYPTGAINVHYGQQYYDNLASAIAAQQTETFVRWENIVNGALLIGIIAMRQGATNLNNILDGVFTPASMFGESVGGVNGISTTTLQQAYNNSVVSEIILNSTLDGFTLVNGTGLNDASTRLYEGANSVGNVTSYIMANGDISANNISVQGIYTSYIEKINSYNALISDSVIVCSSTNAFPVVLPSAIGIKSKSFNIKNIGVGAVTVHTTTVGGNVQYIDDVSTTVLSQWSKLKVLSTGSNWIIL